MKHPASMIALLVTCLVPACDDGSTIAAGDPGGCAGGGCDLDLVCDSSACTQRCPTDSACDFACPGGACTQECRAGSDCAFSCSGGACTQICAAGAECDITCSGGSCTQSCQGPECSVSCSPGNCTTTDVAGGGDGGGGGGGGGDGGGSGLDAACESLCAQTPVASSLQGDCTAATLSDVGGYQFLEPSCTKLADDFDAGIATEAQCTQCYLDAGVIGSHCATAQSACFL